MQKGLKRVCGALPASIQHQVVSCGGEEDWLGEPEVGCSLKDALTVDHPVVGRANNQD